MKRVLITGANSYVGTSFEQYAKLHYPTEFAIDTIDMIDGSWREKNFSDYDVIFHVAGIAHADVGKVTEEQKKLYYRVNTDLAIETAKKAKEDGVGQFIFMSSIIIYGDSAPYGKKKRISLETVPEPSNFYGDSKWQADQGIRKLWDEKFKVCILRPPMIYGKGCKGNYQVLSKLAKRLPFFPDVENERSMLYIENLCEFLCQIIMREDEGIYFPQNKEYVKTSDLVKMIAEVNGKRIFVSKLFNWVVWWGSIVPGKIGCLVNKAFGNLSYDQLMSLYNTSEAIVYSLPESIERTEHAYISEPYPLVSIITAAYNCEKTISETIESVLSQTYPNWEMLIVNDCSKDNTASVVESYASKDGRIKLINLPKNSGAAKARNTAIENAQGRFLAILDSDDLWKSDKLQKQVSFMLQHNYAFTFTSYEVFYDNSDNKKRKLFRAPKKINYKQYLRNTIIGNLTVMIDKEHIKDFQIVNGQLEDVLTWMHFLHKGYTAYGMRENLASYRVASTSKSGNKIKNAVRYYRCLQVQPIFALERIIYEICYLFNATKKRLFAERLIIG